MIKIPVYHYTRITDLAETNGLELGDERYITNEGGVAYIVEIWV